MTPERKNAILSWLMLKTFPLALAWAVIKSYVRLDRNRNKTRPERDGLQR